jgi:Fur family ferric uptake transcriptional regulator
LSLQKDKVENLLKKKGLKFTLERQRLVEEVLKINGHFDSDSLYLTLKEKKIPISRDTVYRTMPLLLESGIIQKSVGKTRRDYFEKVEKGHHDHMVCIECGKVIEFHSEALETLQEKLTEQYNFKLIFHDHRLFGYCKKCQ